MREHHSEDHGDDFDEHHEDMHGEDWEEHVNDCHGTTDGGETMGYGMM
jgi:hypothetical protein